MVLRISLILAFSALWTPLFAAEWSITRYDGAVPYIADETTAAGGGLPDGLVATHEGGDIEAAWYDEPTDRYRHGIMGDAIEAGALVVQTPDGSEHRLRLPDAEVFEDRYPRLADLDGDGTVEAVTIRSSAYAGAAVTIYGLEGERLVEKATTAFIGTPNRWLNIAGIAAYLGADDDEPALQIAYVTTPHIGGSLKLIGYRRGALSIHGEAYGFSNHWIGSQELRLSADMMIDGRLTLALPSANRRALRVMAFGRNGPENTAAITLPGRIVRAIGRVDDGFIVGLDTGEAYRVEIGR